MLFTDFGLSGPYTGQVKAMLHRQAAEIAVVDLFADAPAGALREAAPRRFGAWPDDPAEIVYIDHYGNAMTGLRATAVPSAARIAVGGHRLEPARTIADVPAGAPFWYENANGMIEIAVNRGRADATLGLGIGSEVSVVGT